MHPGNHPSCQMDFARRRLVQLLKQQEVRRNKKSFILCMIRHSLFIDNILSYWMPECMCNWQHKDGCVGSKCQYQYGLSFFHFSCDDCKCVKKPS